MIQKLETEIQLESAVDILINTLRLRLDFKAVLMHYFEGHPEKQPSFFEYVKSVPITFGTLPSLIEEVFFQYLHLTQKTAETDVVTRWDELSNDMTIQPTAYLGTCNQILSSDDRGGLGLGGFNFLRVLAKRNYSVNAEKKIISGTPFFSAFQNLLELIGQQSTDRVAIIDACDTPINSRRLGRLAGYLRLYQWEPYLILNENSLPDEDKLLKCLLEICEGSGIRLQFRLDYPSLSRIGTRKLCEILKGVSQATVSIIIFYVLDPGEESRGLLQSLLAEPSFNELCPSLYTEMRETGFGRIMPKDFNFYWSAYLFNELVVDLSGTVRIFVQNQPVSGEVRLSDPGWEEQILEWHRLYGKKLNHA